MVSRPWAVPAAVAAPSAERDLRSGPFICAAALTCSRLVMRAPPADTQQHRPRKGEQGNRSENYDQCRHCLTGLEAA